jgi:hypothetical protein
MQSGTTLDTRFRYRAGYCTGRKVTETSLDTFRCPDYNEAMGKCLVGITPCKGRDAGSIPAQRNLLA